MMRAYYLNSHIYHIRTEMTGTKHIPISHVFPTDKSKLEELLVDETLSQVCFIEEDESKAIIVDERSMDEDKS